MRILLTGGAEFTGSYMAENLLAREHEMAVVDNLSWERRENLPEGVRFYQLDVRSDTQK